MSIQDSPSPQPMPSDHSSTTPFRFFDLPLELRNEVYAHLFVQPNPINCLRVWFTTAGRHLRRLARENAPDCCGRNFGCAHYDARLRPLTSLLRANRQVSNEALDVMYARNVFRVDLERRGFFQRFWAVGEANLRRVQHLQVVASTEYYAYRISPPGEPQWRFFVPAADHAAQWGALLDGLVTLELVLKIPVWGHHSGWPVWVAQLETVLGFVGEHVGEGTNVSVDDNYSMYLCEAVDRCFRKPFRRVRTKEGDAYYYDETRFDPENLTAPIGSGTKVQR
ncbi:hypothetical protein F5Y04DRAFT_130606 [Hypomontagnella monticulosa]|nr:hypothetical protein F5Y04DRAFT_130606 [Hypomontagnella monticulosa]